MARRYAPVLCSIWDDPDFVALSPAAQRLYLLLLSQKKLTMVGVLPYAPRNWSRGNSETTPNDVECTIEELVAERFVIVDHDTDELLVRTMLKHDPPRGPKSRAAMWRSLSTVDSETIRRACVVYIDAEAWDDPVAQPPDDLKYLRNAPFDTPPDGASNGGPDGARTRARASSDPPATGPPATCHRETQSSSVLTVDTDAPTDDDDFSRTLELIIDAKVADYRPNKPKAYRMTTRTNTIAEEGELIRRMLADGDTPETIALFVLGHGIEAEQERRHATVPWCGPDCELCDGTAWIYPDDTSPPQACPNRQTA